MPCASPLPSIARVCALSFALHAARAHADPARDLALTVDAPADAGCSEPSTLRALVETRIGSLVFLDAQNTRRTLDVVITREQAGYAARLRVRDADGRTLGERSVESAGDDCENLDPALVLVISTLVGSIETPPSAAKATIRPRKLQPRASQPEPAASPIDAGEPLRMALGLGARAAIGLFPTDAGLAVLELLLRLGAFELRTDLAATLPASIDLGDRASARFFALVAGLEGCGVPLDGRRARLSFCAGAQAGPIWASTEGLSQTASSLQPVMALLADATLQISTWPRHGLALRVGASLPVLTPEYFYWDWGEQRRGLHATQLGVFAEIAWLWHFTS